MAFFSNTRVGNFPTTQNPMFGTLNGAVTRVGNTVSLNNLSLQLTSQTPVMGNKNFAFTLNGTTTVCPIQLTTANRNLGIFSLSSTSFAINDGDWQKVISWSTSDGFSGTFNVEFPTFPDKPTISSACVGFGTISVKYGTTSFGAPSSGVVELFGGPENPPSHIIDSNTSTGDKTFTLTNVLSDTTYYFMARAYNLKRERLSDKISIKSQKTPIFYGSANGRAVRIKKLYCSVDGKTKNMKFYGSVNGKTKRIY